MSVSTILLTYADHRSERRQLRPGSYLIGRESGEVPIDDPGVSSTHARLEVSESQVEIVDLGSTNGIYDDEGVRVVDSCVLRPGRSVRLGGATLALEAHAVVPKGTTVVMSSDQLPPYALGRDQHAGGSRHGPHAREDARAGSQRFSPQSGAAQAPVENAEPPMTSSAAAQAAATPEIEFPNPLTYAGKRLLPLGVFTVVAGLITAFSYRDGEGGFNFRGVQLAATLVIGGLVAATKGVLYTLRVRLKRDEPADLVLRTDEAAVTYLRDMVLSRNLESVHVGQGHGVLMRVLYDRLPKLAYMPGYVIQSARDLVYAVTGTAIALLVLLLATLSDSKLAHVVSLVCSVAILLIWSVAAYLSSQNRGFSPKAIGFVLVGAIVVPALVSRTFPEFQLADFDASTYAWLLAELLLAGCAGYMWVRLLKSRLDLHSVHARVSETHLERANGRPNGRTIVVSLHSPVSSAVRGDTPPASPRGADRTRPAAACARRHGHRGLHGSRLQEPG